MTWHNVAALPFNLMQRGFGGIVGGVFVLTLYAFLVIAIAMAIYQLTNSIGVTVQTGTADVVAKRTVPAHYSFTGRTVEFVKDYEILDLRIDGQTVSDRPVPWILERATAGTQEPVQYVAGRFNGKIQVGKFKYL